MTEIATPEASAGGLSGHSPLAPPPAPALARPSALPPRPTLVPDQDPFAQVRSVLDGLRSRVLLVDVERRIRYANDKAVASMRPVEAFLPVPVDELVGADVTPFVALLGEDPSLLDRFWDNPEEPPYDARVSVGDETIDLTVSSVRANGSFSGVMVSWLSATERLRVEQARRDAAADAAVVNLVLTRIIAATTVEEALASVLDTVRVELGWAYGSFWAITPEDRLLRVTAQSGDLGEQFRRVAAESSFAQGVGLSGRTWAQRDVYVATDLEEVGDCALGVAARQAGARSAVCLPIMVFDEVIGTMDFFLSQTIEVTEQRLATLRNVGRLLAQGIERARKEEAKQAAAAELATKVDLLLAAVRAADEGDLTQEIPVAGEDAVGQLAVGLGGLIATLRASMGNIGGTADTLAAAAEQLTGLSQGMGDAAALTSDRASSASSASMQVSASIQTVATAAEEMTASIQEISKNATEAASVATGAVGVASDAQGTVASLGESSAEIGQVVKVITSIAQQTNLLALNATIEAARAGDAGKGFAVVANEVKELAKETARATEDIGRRIDAIQSGTLAAVAAISEISEVIGRINDIQTAIASAVEEQTATTNEIARSVTEAAGGANGIAGDVTQLAAAADDARHGAQDTLASATDLAAMAIQLKGLVGRFSV